jgi:diaminohydroxyphosphoribosylaminopyrimidine deaminase/5-amino-6-(5-phosphoribosylamino)uracil reductase
VKKISSYKASYIVFKAMQYHHNFPAILETLKQLSFQAMGYSSPNPPVACVITDLDGNILSEGHTQRIGENHAEREAYNNFALKFPDANKIPPHLVFVTLEPCTHYGKTPPCVDLFLEYKPVCVYYGLADLNPLVKKRDGLLECRNAGIKVIQSPEISSIGAVFLSGFLSKIEKNKPQIFIKSALSKEGYYADLARTKISLSNPFSNQVTQMLRAKSDAVIVGPVTVYVDYPGLDFRGFDLTTLDLRNTHENDLNQFSDEKNIFTESLFRNISNRQSLDWHNSHLSEYQPFRVFVLSLKRIPDQGFFQKQNLLSEKLDSKKSLFFLLDFEDNNSSHKSLYAKMQEVSSELPVIVADRSELPNAMFSTFSHLSLNTILVEGGNLLYRLFAERLGKEDLIYFINTESSIADGISPDIDLLNKKKVYEKKIDTDTWEVYGE